MARNEVKKIDLHNVDLFHETNLHLPTRTIYFGGTPYTADDVDSISVAQTIKNFLLLEHLCPGKPITLFLNSCGGSWFDGVALYDTIRSLKSPVTIVGIGKLFSMGSIILQAGDARVLTKHTMVMCHAGQDGYSGHPKDFEAWANNSKVADKQMCEIYFAQLVKKNPKITVKQIEKMFDHDTIFTAEQAVEIGLADTIMDYIQKV